MIYKICHVFGFGCSLRVKQFPVIHITFSFVFTMHNFVPHIQRVRIILPRIFISPRAPLRSIPIRDVVGYVVVIVKMKSSIFLKFIYINELYRLHLFSIHMQFCAFFVESRKTGYCEKWRPFFLVSLMWL